MHLNFIIITLILEHYFVILIYIYTSSIYFFLPLSTPVANALDYSLLCSTTLNALIIKLFLLMKAIFHNNLISKIYNIKHNFTLWKPASSEKRSSGTMLI